MRIASVAEVKSNLSAFVKASEDGPVIVTRNGKAVAVLLGLKDDEEIERLILASSKRLRAVLESARSEIRQGKGIAHKEFWQSIDKPPTRSRKKASKKNGAV